MKIRPTILPLILFPTLAAPAFAEIPADGEGIAGLYAGSYMCQDGEHGVVLDIEMSEIEGRSELRLTGTLGFAPVLGGAGGEFAHVAGSFTISGHVVTEPAGNYEAGHLQFQHEEWLLEPEGYGSANFRGQLTRRDDGLWQITGTPLAGPTSEFCSDLIATRFCRSGSGLAR